MELVNEEKRGAKEGSRGTIMPAWTVSARLRYAAPASTVLAGSTTVVEDVGQ
jgi:hypothetical protein